MKKRTRNELIVFIVLLAFVGSLVTLLLFKDPIEIVNMLGIHNSYLIGFISSFLGGFSAITSFSMVAVLLTLVAGGVNPLFLGIISGLGLAAGDLIMFFLLEKGRNMTGKKLRKRLDKFADYFRKKHHKILIPILTFIYIGLTPLPNDILIAFLAIIKYPRKNASIPIILGDIAYPLLITLLTAKGIMFFG